MEIWIDVKEYELIYEVSNLGNVRNKSTNRILKQKNSRVHLYCKNIKDQSLIREIVYHSFNNISLDVKLKIMHLNNNRFDNRLCNLTL